MKKAFCLMVASLLIFTLWACGNRTSTWKEDSALPDSGNWKLDCDVNITTTTTLTGDLVLDLNGHTVTRTVTVQDDQDQHAISVPKGINLTLKDSGTEGKMVASFKPGIKSSGPATIIWGEENSSVVIESGTFDSSYAESIYVQNFGGAIATAGKLTVNGGTILGYRNIASSGDMDEDIVNPGEQVVDGGGTAIAGWETSEIVINNGDLLGGGTQQSGGGLIASNGVLTINGGTFALDPLLAGTANTSPNGGLILMDKNGAGSASLTINGGSFTGGDVAYHGGCILTFAPATINGGNFTASMAYQGGVIMADSCDLVINGGDFVGSGRTHEGNGGLVCATGEKLTINGGSFKNGCALNFGNNIYYKHDGGQILLTGDTYINGGLTVHGIASAPVSLTFRDRVIVDNSESNPTPPWNIRMRDTKLYLNDATEHLMLAGSANTDVSLTYDEAGTINGFVDGTP